MNDVVYLKPPCPPTLESLLAHYQECADACVLPEHREEFLREIAELRKAS